MFFCLSIVLSLFLSVSSFSVILLLSCDVFIFSGFGIGITNRSTKTCALVHVGILSSKVIFYVYLSFYLYIYPSIFISVLLSLFLSSYQSISSSVFLSYLSFKLSFFFFCLFVFLLFRIWDRYNKPVNKDMCACSCWDTVFKGNFVCSSVFLSFCLSVFLSLLFLSFCHFLVALPYLGSI
jgi:hypothetical protein